MQHINIQYNQGFKVVSGDAKSQAAVMVLTAGSSTGGPNNFHAESDQWLFVSSGQGKAIVDDQEIEIDAGSLVLIKSGERHEIANTGDQPLETINIYLPPAY
jgi:mannose-6-phosphate isomerase-like protein (cupin superfamily)